MNAVRVNIGNLSIDIDASGVEYRFERGKGWVGYLKGDDLLWTYIDPLIITMPATTIEYDQVTRQYVYRVNYNNIINTINIVGTVA